MPRDQTNKHLYSMLHPFLHILYTCTKSPFPISPQKANLDMLTLDRHQSEQAPIIFINTHHTRIEPHTIRFTSYTPSVWNSSLLNFSTEHAHSQIGQSRFFFFATQSLRSTSTPPSSFCPGLAVTNILVDHGNQVSGRLARLLCGLHYRSTWIPAIRAEAFPIV